MFFFNQPRWKTVEYSRTQIIKAGKVLKNENALPEDIKSATNVVDNWRAAHAYPLHVIYMYMRRLAANRNDIIVAERLKRLDSIINKLKREPTMSLWTMQDLGGCRFVVPTNGEVYSYSDKMIDSRIRHRLVKVDDYIKNPQPSGYRSLHLVFEYNISSLAVVHLELPMLEILIAGLVAITAYYH